ncbi:MAG: sulfite exporter TauE/SafE family protein, partial [Methylococcales bacterium]|nr:sulfite exporter TauE/SafE family protein [Methylococcales bacterium]
MIRKYLNTPFTLTAMFTLVTWAVWSGYTYPNGQATIAQNWPITLTMVFGSFIAGATSEGGGAIAFPVFTKVLAMPPFDAKVFSLAIQSIGMMAATVTITV